MISNIVHIFIIFFVSATKGAEPSFGSCNPDLRGESIKFGSRLEYEIQESVTSLWQTTLEDGMSMVDCF